MTLAGDFAAGDYTIVLTDTYADGWAWAGVAGGIDGYGVRLASILFSLAALVPLLWSLRPDWLFWASQACPAAFALVMAIASLRKHLG